MLNIKENIHNRMVLTSRGFRLEEHINVGDRIYNFDTNNFEEVVRVGHRPFNRLFIIHYSDGRDTFICEKELIRMGDMLYRAQDFIEYNIPRAVIKTKAVVFPTISTPVDPSAYIAGTLFGYADYNEERINIPAYADKVALHICNKYHYRSILNGNKIFFKYHKSVGDQYITWKDLFTNYDFYSRYHDITDPPIPREYIYGTYQERVQFIRGVFDVGYQYELSNDQVCLYHDNYERLELIQRMLWSIGILNKIYDNKIKFKYRLDIIDEYRNYPGFFYDEFCIRNMVDADNRIVKSYDYHETLTIDSITEIPNPFLNELLTVIEFEKPHVNMCNELYLSRISK